MRGLISTGRECDRDIPDRRHDRRGSCRLGDGQSTAGAGHRCGLSGRWSVILGSASRGRVVVLAGGSGVCCRLLHERRADRAERVCARPLSDGGACHRRKLDAGHGTVRQHLRLGSRRRAARPRLGVWRDSRTAWRCPPLAAVAILRAQRIGCRAAQPAGGCRPLNGRTVDSLH